MKEEINTMFNTEPIERLFFNTDDEFTNFCMSDKPIIKIHKATGWPYYEYDYTEEYKDACLKNKQFIIKQPKSLVLKRGCVTRDTISLPVTNVYSIDEYEC